MKKIALLLVLISTLVGCTLDNENKDTYSYSILPIDSYTLPPTFKLGETYAIKLKYQRPTACYLFEGIYYNKNLNTRTIAIQAAVKDNQACTTELPPLSEASFNFQVTATGSYIFKFYKGKDAENKDLYEEVVVQVTP